MSEPRASSASGTGASSDSDRDDDAPDACPDLALLEARSRRTSVRSHIAGCPSCALVAELFDRVADGAALDVADCTQFDALLAARTDGTLARAGLNLLERHLAGCAECRAVAETLSPLADTEGDHDALPSVDPAGYALGLEIARGGMGRVIAARDLRVGRPVAVKELLGRSPQLAARFEREARVTARLQHPGIVPIYEIGKWPDGTPFYSMRMVDGRTLRDALAAAATLGERLALLPALISAASAVAFAHSQRVIHRDLTPANVIVGAYGETVVIDWGLAKDLASETEPESEDPYRSATSSSSLTNVGAVIGTAPYMPPEQAHAQPVDERADVYALGAILYHLLAGVPPYEGPTTAALLRAVKTGPPAPIDAMVSGAPRDLVSIADKAMAREPEARYPSARELVEELERFRTGRMVEAHEYSTHDRVRRFVHRHRAAVITTLAAALVLAVVAGVAVTRVYRSNKVAKATVRDLLLEKGRIELLGGDSLRALAYLDEARRQGDHSPALDFLLGSASRSAQEASSTLDCGGMVRHVAFAPNRVQFAAACTDVGKIWRLDKGHAELAELARFPGGYNGIAYSHDGASLLTWGKDGVARLWDASTGELRGSFEHGDQITFGSFTPDDAIIATTGHDGMARVWDARTGTQLRAIEAGTGLMRHTYGSIAGNGKHVLTITIEGEGQGWDLASGERLGGFTHGGQISGGHLALDGTRAITCGMDHLAKVWNAETGEHVVTLSGHTDIMWKCVFSPDGTYAITSGHDRRTNVWALPSGRLVRTIVHDDVAWTGEVAPDNSRFTTVTLDGRVKVWDLVSGALLATHDSARGKDARFSLDGKQLVVQRGDGRLQIWTDSTTRRGTFAAKQRSIIGFDDNGRVVATTSTTALDGRVTLTDLSTGAAIPTSDLFEPVAFGGDRIAATRWDGIAILDLDGTAIATLPGARAEQLVMAANGQRIALATATARWEVWDLRRRARISTLHGARLALSFDGKRAVTWREDAPAPLVTWDVDRSARLAALTPPRIARPIGFSRDGHRVVVVESPLARDQALSIWNAETGAAVLAAAPTRELQLAETQTNVLPAIDPSGRLVTTIRADHRLTVWNISDGRPRTSFVADYVQYAQARADGALIAAIGEYGNAAFVLDAVDGRPLARWSIATPSPSVSEVDFTPPKGVARWSTDGEVVVTHTTIEVSAWRVSTADIARIGDVVKKTVPYRVVDGRLELVKNGRLHGTIERAGAPVAGATVWIEIRIVPELTASSQSWEGVTTKIARRQTVTDADGAFSIAGLVPGTYSLTVTDRGRTSAPISVTVSADGDPIPTIRLPAP